MAVTATFDEATGNLILKPQVADVWSYGGMEFCIFMPPGFVDQGAGCFFRLNTKN